MPVPAPSRHAQHPTMLALAVVMLALLLCAVVPARGQSGDAAEPAPPRAVPLDPPQSVLFVNPGFADRSLWTAVADTMRAAADDLGFTVTVVGADRDRPLMLQRGREALAAGRYDFAILVNDRQRAVDLLLEADRREIPTLMLLNGLTRQQRIEVGAPRTRLRHWLGSLTPDNATAGFEMASALAAAADRRGLAKDGRVDLLTLAGDFRTPASIDRLAGLDRALERFASLSERRRLTVNWSEDEAYRRTALWLRSNRAEAIWAANDAMALGAMRALAAAGRTPGKDVLVAGLNWSPAGLAAVADGRMVLTHGGHFLGGAWAIVLLYDLVNGYDFRDFDLALRFPMHPADQETARRLLRRFGDGDWSRIDFRDFTRTAHPTRGSYSFTLEALLASGR